MVECKIVLDNIDKIADFIKATAHIEEFIDLKSGTRIVDGHSLEGIFCMPSDQPIELKIHSDDESILDKFNEWRVD
jgi:hypothetical protein